MKKRTGTLARPWKLKVRTYSPFLVSLCRTRNTPCPMWPCCRTSWAASSRDSVPWNHGYSRNICSTCVSSLPESTKQKHKWLMWNSQVYMGFLLALTRGLTLQLNLYSAGFLSQRTQVQSPAKQYLSLFHLQWLNHCKTRISLLIQLSWHCLYPCITMQ